MKWPNFMRRNLVTNTNLGSLKVFCFNRLHARFKFTQIWLDFYVKCAASFMCIIKDVNLYGFFFKCVDVTI